MNKIYPILVLCLFAFAACTNSGPENTVLQPNDFNDKIDKLSNEVVIDLRSHAELHRMGPIKGSKNIDFNSGRLLSSISGFQKDTPLMIYCASGGRSAKAAQQLKSEGYTKVYDLEGGLNAWKEAGLPISAHRH